MAQGVEPEMPGQLFAIAQLPQVMSIAESMGAVGIRAVRFPMVMHGAAGKMRQDAGGIHPLLAQTRCFAESGHRESDGYVNHQMSTFKGLDSLFLFGRG